MITAVHLGCKSVTIPMDPKSSKGTFLSKTRVWTDMGVPLFIKQSGGGRRRGQVPAQYWFWYIGFGCGWWESLEQGLGRGCLSCRWVEDEEVFTRSSS